jgi:choline dehydrogenase-like flavoprotein
LLIDARSLESGTVREADVCIVGAGAAGITLARELAGGKLRVALLESGGIEDDPETQELYRGRVHGRAYFTLDAARTRRFGGSTWCWHGLCRPLEPADFEVREWVPDSGWPFGAVELRPFYERAQDVIGLDAFDYGPERWSGEGLAPISLGSDFESRVFQVSPLRFGIAYRDDVIQAPNIDTYLFANLTGFSVDTGANRVEAARVATLTGRRFSVRARLFVLATGGIENARLLLASNDVQAAGLGNGRDLVGRYFMEHPHLVAGALLRSSEQVSIDFYRAREAGQIQVAGLLVPSAALQRREKLLAFGSFLSPSAELPPFESALSRLVTGMDRPGEEPASRAFFFMNECEQAPNAASRVRLDEDRDALGVPRVKLEWRLSNLDRESLRRGHELLAHALGRAGLGRFQVMLDAEDLSWPAGMTGGRHHMGTTRMHASPQHGVVDPDARVHGVANLYVAGSSVFPTSGASNPTLTIVALSLRLAERIREVLA